MTDNSKQLQDLFKKALELPAESRENFLDEACEGNTELKTRLVALLAADAEAEEEDFLGQAPDEWADSLLESEKKHELLGTKIGPYTLIRQIGEGGMGEVFQALREEPFRQYVALKLVKPGMDSKEILKRFQLERQILASLNHPNISRLLDGGSAEKVQGVSERPYLVMEYIEGVSITEYCDTNRLQIKDRLALFSAACNAVHYAHRNLVIHRDLKPSNILVTKDGDVKLLDFGVAKLLNPSMANVDMPITRTEIRAMTPEYASPEQVRGETLTTSSDVYSLGVVLYELLTGRRPYRLATKTTKEIEELVCDLEPEKPSSRVAKDETFERSDGSNQSYTSATLSSQRDVTTDRLQRNLRGDLDNIVMMALRKEANRRYASAEKLASDIGNYVSGKPIEARSNTWGYRSQKFISRHPISTLAAALLTCFVFAFASTLVFKNSQITNALELAENERTRAELERDKAQGVTQFLSSLFEFSNPSESLGDTLTARHILLRGREKIQDFDDQPEVKAEMMSTIGGVFESLGMFEESRDLLKQSVDLSRSLGDTLGLEYATRLSVLAASIASQGKDFATAEEYYNESLVLQRKLDPSPRVLTGWTLLQLSTLKHFSGDFSSSESLLRESIDQFNSEGIAHSDAATSMKELAKILHVTRRHAEADSLFLEAIDMYKELYGEVHPSIAVTIHNYGSSLVSQRKGAKAKEVQLEALEMFRSIYGEDFYLVGHVYRGLADAYALEKDHDAAVENYLKAIRIIEKVAPDQPALATFIIGLGGIYRMAGRYVESEQRFLEGISIRRQKFGRDHSLVLTPLLQLARTYEHWGKDNLAEERLLEAKAMGERIYKVDSPRRGNILLRLANLLSRNNRHEESEALIKDATDILGQEKVEQFLKGEQNVIMRTH